MTTLPKKAGPEIIGLIERCKDGDERSIEKLLCMIRDRYMQDMTARYRGRNDVVEDEEIESEFLVGCFQALRRVDPHRGNPLFHIMWRGRLRVASFMKSKIKREVQLSCRDCGDVLLLGWQKRARRVCCPACGSLDVVTRYALVDEAAAHDSMVKDGDAVWSEIMIGVQIEELRSRLSGRVLELFDAIVVEGIERASSANYLREIADRWGVSTPCVAIYLRKLRRAVSEYFEGEAPSSTAKAD